MTRGLPKVFKGLFLTPLVLALVFVMACGSSAPAEPAATQAPAQPAATQAPAQPAATTAPAQSSSQPAATQAPQIYEKKQHEGQAAQVAPGVKAETKDNPYYIAEAKRGGFINMSQYADVRQRMIHQSSVLNMNMAPLFNNLVEYNPETSDQADIRCDLCESWELADDGMTYTFNVHPDAMWWDGTPVTGKDIVFSLEAWWPRTSSRPSKAAPRPPTATPPSTTIRACPTPSTKRPPR